jgi:hypothetical protein
LFLQDRRQERQAGREARKALELRSESSTPGVPGAAAPRGAVITAGPPGLADREGGAVWLVVLMVAARALQNRDFAHQVIVRLIVVAALARMAREGMGHAVRALVAWDHARLAEWEKEHRQREANGASP